ncbi:MAG: hypothetical protein KIS63_23540, partial [Caldilineales bacterium]|nr:hypothetical protein [Caldilineales bacterium]
MNPTLSQPLEPNPSAGGAAEAGGGFTAGEVESASLAHPPTSPDPLIPAHPPTSSDPLIPAHPPTSIESASLADRQEGIGLDDILRAAPGLIRSAQKILKKAQEATDPANLTPRRKKRTTTTKAKTRAKAKAKPKTTAKTTTR